MHVVRTERRIEVWPDVSSARRPLASIEGACDRPETLRRIAEQLTVRAAMLEHYGEHSDNG